MKNRTKFILFIGVVLLFGLILLTVGHKRAKTLTTTPTLGTNIRFAHQVNTTDIQFFSGSAFGTINPQNGQTSALTRFYRFPNVQAVRWGAHGAVFQASNYSELDDLYPLLAQSNLDTNASYWWSIDFRTEAISLVGSDTGMTDGTHIIRDVQWAKNSATYYFVQATKTDDNQSNQPMLYRNTNGQSVLLGPIEATSLLGVAKDKILYEADFSTGGELHAYTLSSNKDELLRSQFSGTGALSDDANWAVYVNNSVVPDLEGEEVVPENAVGKLIVLDLRDNTEKTVSETFSGGIAWDNNQWIALQNDGTGFIGEGKNVSAVGLAKFNLTLSNDSLCGYLQSAACLISSDNTLHFATANPTTFKASALDQTQIRKGKLVPDQYEISYDTSRGVYDIYVYGDVTSNSQKASKYIHSLGIDPLQLPLRWYYDGSAPLIKEAP